MNNKDTKKNKKAENKENPKNSETKTKIEFPKMNDLDYSKLIYIPPFFSAENFDFYNEIVQNKLDIIKSNDAFIKSPIKRISNYDPEDLQIAYLERDVFNILDHINISLSIAFELPNNKILLNMAKDYIILTNFFKIELLNKGLERNTIRNLCNNIDSTLNFWSEVSYYFNSLENFSIERFNKPTFNFDFSLISKFYSIIEKADYEKYTMFLKFQFSLSGSTISSQEFENKLRNVVDFHSQYTEDYFYYSVHSIMKITFQALKELGLENDFISFSKIVENSNSKIILTFKTTDAIKTNISDIALIFYFLKEKSIIYYNYNSLLFNIKDKLRSYSNIENNLKTHHKELLTKLGQSDFKYENIVCNNWYQQLIKLHYFRKTLLLDNFMM